MENAPQTENGLPSQPQQPEHNGNGRHLLEGPEHRRVRVRGADADEGGHPVRHFANDPILGPIEIGMPLRKVEHLNGMESGHLKKQMDEDSTFRAKVRQARSLCMKSRLDALAKASQWQAATFLLESLWPQRFGRNRKPLPKQVSPIDTSGIDFDNLTEDEQKHFDRLMSKLHGKAEETEPQGADSQTG